MKNKKQDKLSLVDILLAVVFWSIIIIAMEKLKWEAAKVLSLEWAYMIIGSVAIIIGEYFKYSAVRHVRKILGLK